MKALRILLVVALAGMGSAGFAQITVTASNFPGVGTSIAELSTSEVTVNLGSPGPNQTWNFSAYEFFDSYVTQIVSPSGTPYAASFPAATHAFTADDVSDSYLYTQLTAAGFYQLGMGWEDESGENVLVYESPAQSIALPLTYGTTWTEAVAYEIMGIEIHFLTQKTVDAWGTLVTPHGSWPALRIRNQVRTWYVVPGFPSDTTEYYAYDFVTQDPFTGASVQPGFGITSPEFTTGTVSVTTTGATSAADVPAVSPSGFALGANYPNPFNPSTTLPLTLERAGRVELRVHDATGRLVMSGTHELTAGSHHLPINGSAWASGLYFATVSVPGHTATRPMMLLK